jgi:CheY-like chemotaxis protein
MRFHLYPNLYSTIRMSIGLKINMEEKKKSILVVDDDRSILETVRDILQFEGYSVETAETGREALEKLENHVYNLALLDIRLSDMEGVDLLAKINNFRLRMVKIMITGYPKLDNAVKSLNLGADAYITKPVKAEELLKVIEKKLKEQEEAEKIRQREVMGVLDGFMDRILDGDWWTIGKMARELNTSKYVVEKGAQFYAKRGIIKYWRGKGIFKISEDFLLPNLSKPAHRKKTCQTATVG